MTAEIPDDIIRYVAARDRDRAERVDQTLAALTPREQALVREAAVMGYVRGVFAAGGPTHDVEIPKDTAIVRHVIACCQDMPDTYRHLGGEAR